MVSRSPTPSLRRILPKVTRVLLRLTPTPQILSHRGQATPPCRDGLAFPKTTWEVKLQKLLPKTAERIACPSHCPLLWSYRRFTNHERELLSRLSFPLPPLAEQHRIVT